VKSNKSYVALCDSPKEPEISREELDAQIKAYLAKGGKIQELPRGASGYMPVNMYAEQRKKRDE
jgi:hypothetical protein